jgi:hypothetical protein
MFDGQTEQEADYVQQVLRASTASEAMRYTVRKMAELMHYMSMGAKIRVAFFDALGHEETNRALLVDIPACPHNAQDVRVD